MNSKMGASKSQNQKLYGSVEKMYIHFYTVGIEGVSDTQYIYWYCNDTENVELFSDFKHYFNTLKNYGHYTTYTGDIFVVKNLHKFKEILILLGAEQSKKSVLELSNNSNKEVEEWKVKNSNKFNDLFDLCFQDYEILNSFSSEPLLAKNRVEMDELINTLQNDKKDSLIIVSFIDENRLMTYYNFNQLKYSFVKSRVDNTTLFNWFSTLIKKNEYYSAFNTIIKLNEFNSLEDNKENNTEDIDDIDDTTVITESESSIISHNEWINLFCNLYLEEDKGSDILLSDIYQMYLTASGWSGTATISMGIFIKRLRALNKYTIKRRAKGMMIIGYKCLVGQQAEMFQQVKKGQLYKRQLFQYKSPYEIKSILEKYNNGIQNIGHKYTREVFILLNNYRQIDYQTVAQFASIPQIAAQLPLYADYIESILKVSPTDSVNSNEIQKPLEDFRELGNKCTLYYPFVLGNYNKQSFIYDLKESYETMPSAFNEHFGMFASSKNYHLYEPEKGTPQEYNNMMGTPLDSTEMLQHKKDKKDFSIWRESSRVVPTLDLRGNSKI